MKKRFKNSILLFVSLLILSCTNEKNFVHEKDHHSKISDKSFDELSKMLSFTTAFEKIPKKAKATSLLSDSRSALEEEFDFTFSNKPAKVIEEDEKTSYTFLINRTVKDSTFFENLIIEINQQMKARAVIAKYVPSAPLVVEQENKVGFEGNIISTKLFDEIDPNVGDWVMPVCYLVNMSLCVTPPDCGGMICGFGVVNWCSLTSGPGGGGGGGGSGSGSGSSSPSNPLNNLNTVNTVIVPPLTSDQKDWAKFLGDLSVPQQDFIGVGPFVLFYNLSPLATKIKAYLTINEYGDETKDFMSWAITYLDNHPNTTWDMFKNQFMGTTEGSDGDYDAAYWDDPNLTFPAQSLPTWANFYNAFPKHVNGNYITSMNNHEVYNLVGGHPKTAHLAGNSQYQNACALRGSRALNYSNKHIGIYSVDNQQVTEKGDDNENYILNARAFNTYMNKTFGAPTSSLKNSNNTPLSYTQMATFLIGKTGIYNIINFSANAAGYSGHVDLIVNGQCLSGADINPGGGVLKIEIWELN